MEEKKRPGTLDRNAKRRIFRRTVALMIIFGVLAFIPLVARLYQLQIIDHEYYQELATDQQTRDVTVSASRGTIYDATGNILASSATVHTVIISPKDIIENDLDQALIATGLAELTGVDPATILKKMENTKSQYEVIKKKVEEEDETAIRAFISENGLSSGIYLIPDSKRYYPKSSLAAHVIGFVNDNGGAYGIEAYYEEELAGTAGRVVTAKNGAGVELLYRYEDYIDAMDGSNLHLTIDPVIQAMAERTLEEGIETFSIRKGGFCIVMDPDTGAVLAMASSPEYDLNNYGVVADEATAELLEQMKADEGISQEDYLKALGNAQVTQWRNKCLDSPYEPGSTFKALVVAAALEEGVVSLSDSFTCTGSYKVATWNISCHDHEGHGTQTLTKAVMNSCNPAFIQIGMKLGAERFYDYLESYGLLGYTGIDLPEEVGSIIWSRENFTSEQGLASLATASFGQTMKITPIQLITAAAAVVNGGHLMEPYVLQTVTDSDGNVLWEHEPVEVRQVISQQTSQTVADILEQVVGGGGTGKNAYVAGYSIGGKTGTSEKRDEDTGDNIVSFLGFAPADDPQVIVLLAYDSPTPAVERGNYTAAGQYISGGNMAAPMAGPLIGDILDYLGVEKQYTSEELSGADVMTPAVVGYPLEEAVKALSAQGLDYRTVGEGETVTGQIPAQGASIPGGSQVILYMGAELPTEQVEVPDLTGRSPDSVRQTLNSAGLFLRASGQLETFTSSAVSVTQSIEPGTMVDPGTVIEVRFMDTIDDYARN